MCRCTSAQLLWLQLSSCSSPCVTNLQYVSKFDRRETQRYLQMFYHFKLRCVRASGLALSLSLLLHVVAGVQSAAWPCC